MLSKSEVKYIQSLSQKKLRDDEGCFIVEGPKIVSEAITSPQAKIVKIYALEDWALKNTSLPAELEIITEPDLARISQLKTPNQVLAVVQKPDATKFILQKQWLCLALDGIQDPGNLGTIIRTADWFGVKQIICSMDSADAYNPKVVQSTMGSIFRIELLYTHLEAWMEQHSDISFYATALHGEPLKNFCRLNSGVIVIGNESKGVREGILSKVHRKITIERIGEAESLNAAVATGIVLSAVTQ